MTHLSNTEGRAGMNERVQMKSALHPLSFGQLSYWVWYFLHGDPWNLTFQFKVSDGLDVTLFEEAVRNSLRSHDAFLFRVARWKPVQAMHDSEDLEFAYIDLADCPQDSVEGRINAQYDWERPLGSKHSPQTRVVVFECPDDEHLIVITFSHVVADGASIQILVNQIFATYFRQELGRPAPIKSYHGALIEYVRRERLAFGSRAYLARCETYWRAQCAGARSFELPENLFNPDRVCPNESQGTLDQATIIKAQASAAKQKMSLPMYLITVVMVVLARIARQNDLTIHVLRDDRMVNEPTVGQFSTEVPIRARIEPSATIKDLATDVRSSLLESYEYRHNAVPEALLFVEERPIIGRFLLSLFTMVSIVAAKLNMASDLDWRCLRYFFLSTFAWGWGRFTRPDRTKTRRTRVLVNVILNSGVANHAAASSDAAPLMAAARRLTPADRIEYKRPKEDSKKCLNISVGHDPSGKVFVSIRGGGLTQMATSQMLKQVLDLFRELGEESSYGIPIHQGARSERDSLT